MNLIWESCGHDRIAENTQVVGPMVCCRICRDALHARRRQETLDKRAAIVEAFRSGMAVAAISDRFQFGQNHVKRILREEGAITGREGAFDPLFAARAIKVAAELAGANVTQIKLDWRKPKQLVHARWCVMKALRDRGASTVAIGRHLHRDHSTIVYGLRQADIYAARSPDFRAMLEQVEAA